MLDASLFMTQPWLDVPELAWSAVVVTDGRKDLAQARADELAQMAWDRRERVLAPKVPIDSAPRTAAQAEVGPASARSSWATVRTASPPVRPVTASRCWPGSCATS